MDCPTQLHLVDNLYKMV